MSKGQRNHIVKRPDGQWAEQTEGARRAAALHSTQAAAQAAATERLRQRPGGGEVVIHDRHGQIRDSNTINRRDPYPPKG
jgi:hypothetical protein